MSTDIWNALEPTDPKYTKNFKKGFSGTAINPTYGMKKLTEVFGACGVGWGDEIIESRFDEGAWFNERDRETIHTIILKLWFYNGEGEKASVIGVGTTTFIGQNKHGVFTDEEYFKKTMTDALSNASKKLGLSADIFMGLYDDSKYLNEVTQKFAPPPPMPKRADVNKALQACTTVKEIDDIANKVEKKYGETATLPTGHKSEIWSQLFETHYKRVKGIQPFNANETPEDLQKRFDTMVDTCQDWATYGFCEKMYLDNPALKITKNFTALERLEKDMHDRHGQGELGDRS
jgi:hypothetical protein